MRDKKNQVQQQIPGHQFVDFNKLVDIRNYHDLLAFLLRLKRKEFLLASIEQESFNEANRLAILSRSPNRNATFEEQEVLLHCSTVYSEYGEAIKTRNWSAYDAKIEDLISLCWTKNKAAVQDLQSQKSRDSLSRVKKSNSSTKSSGQGSSSCSQNQNLLGCDGSDYMTKLQFLSLSFNEAFKNKKSITLSDYQEKRNKNSINNSSKWLELIQQEYNELKSQCCPCGFFDSFRSNFFDGAYKYAKEKLGVKIDEKELTSNQRLWIILKYADKATDGPYQRTKNAVDNVTNKIREPAPQMR